MWRDTFTYENYKDLSFIAPHFECNQQQDAHEFLHFVIEGLGKSSLALNTNSKLEFGDKFMTPIDQIFVSYIKKEITCLECQYKSFTYDQTMDFMLDITHKANSLGTAFSNYIQPEVIIQDYSCKCKYLKVNARIEIFISKIPKVITFQLKRFHFIGLKRQKVHNSITYPNKLNVRPYLENPTGDPLWYELSGVIVHSGCWVVCLLA